MVNYRYENIVNDPATSDWLKNTLRGAIERDPVDTLNDIDVLKSVIDKKYEDICLREMVKAAIGQEMENVVFLSALKWKSQCGAIIIDKFKEKGIVVLVELKDNHGTSVTNDYQNIASMLYREKLADRYKPDEIIWIEHQEKEAKKFDLVELQWENNAYQRPPEWSYISDKGLQDALEELVNNGK